MLNAIYVGKKVRTFNDGSEKEYYVFKVEHESVKGAWGFQHFTVNAWFDFKEGTKGVLDGISEEVFEKINEATGLVEQLKFRKADFYAFETTSPVDDITG